MILASSVDWTTVIVSLITVVPAIIAAVYAGRIHGKIKTPSGTPIGKQVENALHTALANNYHLRAIGGTVDAPKPESATAEEAKVTDMPEGNGGMTPPEAGPGA